MQSPTVTREIVTAVTLAAMAHEIDRLRAALTSIRDIERPIDGDDGRPLPDWLSWRVTCEQQAEIAADALGSDK